MIIPTDRANFSFWTPVVFANTDKVEKFDSIFWRIGSWADQFASLTPTELDIKTIEQVNLRKFSFEAEEIAIQSNKIAKIAAYVITGGILFLVAFVIKAIFKSQLNAITTLKSPNTLFDEKMIGKTKITLFIGSLLDETTDAVVNAANNGLAAGGGICGAFRKEAGDKPFTECKEILKKQKRAAIDTGEAVATSSGDLAPRVKVIVHTAGPDLPKKIDTIPSDAPEVAQLKAAYRSSLELITDPKKHAASISKEAAVQFDKPMRSIGFCSISTGIFYFPLVDAAPLALGTVKEFIEEHPDALDEVRFVFVPDGTADYYQQALKNL